MTVAVAAVVILAVLFLSECVTFRPRRRVTAEDLRAVLEDLPGVKAFYPWPTEQRPGIGAIHCPDDSGAWRAVTDRIPVDPLAPGDYSPGKGWEFWPARSEWRRTRWVPVKR